jgi:hypothetical protein
MPTLANQLLKEFRVTLRTHAVKMHCAVCRKIQASKLRSAAKQ